MKRSGKFYRRNEAEVMKMLGFKPTVNSGSGWIEKEDGQSENAICQLKSTDASSIKVNKKDLDVLSYNASVAHKIPVFAIQFLQSNEVYLILKPDLLSEVSKYIETGHYETSVNEFIGVNVEGIEDDVVSPKKKIKSSSKAREQFKKENDRKFRKEKKSAT